MNRTQFIQYTAAQALHPSANAAQAREHAKAAKLAAELLADELGMKDEPDHFAGGSPGTDSVIGKLTAKCGELQEELGKAHLRVRELEERHSHCEGFQRRIAELEQDLEKATAPKGRASR